MILYYFREAFCHITHCGKVRPSDMPDIYQALAIDNFGPAL
jgi:hypothetical protein